MDQKYVKKFNSSGTYVSKYGSRDCWAAGGDFCHPRGVFIDSSDKIWVADTNNNLVKQISFNASNVGSKVSTLSTEPVSRMDIARKVIKRIVSNTELTSSANFGLMEWGHPYRSIRWLRLIDMILAIQLLWNKDQSSCFSGWAKKYLQM